MAQAGAVLQNTYVLADRLGTGGMGEVFVASHTRLQKRFAVKVLAAHHAHNHEAFTRFRREAEIASRLGHPNIVEVIDFNQTEDGQPFLVMELLDGEDLAARIARGRLEPEAALRIAEQIAAALQAAHAQEIVHRDLKPQNVFLVRRGRDDAWVKILDFGISKIRGDTNVTHSQVVIGTPGYMAPEQAEGRVKLIDARSDQFALAVIVYEMLSGTAPFASETIPSTLYRIVHDEPPRLDEVRPGTPAHVAATVARAMEKRPDRRFPDVATFAAALRGEVDPQFGASISETSERRLVVGSGAGMPAGGSATTMVHADTAISTGGLAGTTMPVRRGRTPWLIAGALAVVGGAIATVLALDHRAPREIPAVAPAHPATAPAPDPAAAPAPDPAVVPVLDSAAPAERGRRRDRKREPKAAATKPAAIKSAATKPEPTKSEPTKPEPAKPEPTKPREGDFITDF